MELDELKAQYSEKQDEIDNLDLENSSYYNQIDALRTVIEQINEFSNTVYDYEQKVLNSYYRFNSAEEGTRWQGDSYNTYSNTVDNSLYPGVRDYYYAIDGVVDQLNSKVSELEKKRDANENLLIRLRNGASDLWYNIAHFFD